jgi:ABC-2 type transport system ATP-binding protein
VSERKDEKYAIYVENLIKVYSGGLKALDGVSLRVKEGEIHAVVGPNGAGKTTLMRILTTQIQPTSGHACVLGYDVRRESGAVRKLISYVPQEFSVWTDITGYENLLFYSKIYGIPSDERHRIISDALELMGLSEASGRLVRTYSGGMIRRLEIAAALMVKPRVIFLDEPTIGLDPRAREVVWEKLLEYQKEYRVTVLFNTHYMDEAERYAEKVTFLNRGRVIAKGTPQELVKLLGGETIKVLIEGEPGRASQILSSIDGIQVLSSTSNQLIIVTPDSSVMLPKIVQTLSKSGVEVRSTTVSRPTLEDVFIKLTGMSIEEAEKASGLREVRAVRRAIRAGG